MSAPDADAAVPEFVEELRFFVEGTPAPKGSKKHVGRGRMIEVSKRLPAWERAVQEAATAALAGREGFGVREPVAVSVRFDMPRPKSVTRDRPAVAPDLDKLMRAVLDPLQKAKVYPNDAQVVGFPHASKHYAPEGHPSGAYITIRRSNS